MFHLCQVLEPSCTEVPRLMRLHNLEILQVTQGLPTRQPHSMQFLSGKHRHRQSRCSSQCQITNKVRDQHELCFNDIYVQVRWLVN